METSQPEADRGSWPGKASPAGPGREVSPRDCVFSSFAERFPVNRRRTRKTACATEVTQAEFFWRVNAQTRRRRATTPIRPMLASIRAMFVGSGTDGVTTAMDAPAA